MILPVFIKPVSNNQIFVKYNDGLEGNINLSFLFKNFIYQDLKNEEIFKTVCIDKETNDIVWANNITICKDMLYNHLKLLKLADNLKIDLSKL
ncbi:MAG TPA: DUF2442 domain-containing protein [Melioribacteraceae bacterium]|nr:DUF2442 domain-containing protein [Melioribacteraceae bacterium]